MAERLGHERQLSFFQSGGHNHDGENSSPVEILPGAISLFHLNSGLKDWIINQISDDADGGNNNVFITPDIEFETPPIAPGGSYSGSVPWVGISVVRFVRILMSVETECNLTFYHIPSYADEDREFRVIGASDKFLWEGAWAHFDESNNKMIHYKVENTGTQSAVFKVQMKSATMAANHYARFVHYIQAGSNMIDGPVELIGQNGINVTSAGNQIYLNATAPETVFIRRWALTPVKPAAITSSVAGINTGLLLQGRTDTQTPFGTGIQWVQADLGGVKNLGGVRVVMYMNDGRVYNDVRVEVSPDGTNWLQLKSSGPVWATSDGIMCNIASGYLARYIRVWSNGSTTDTTNHISTIQPLVLSNKE